jgi:ABC-2 type transport system ATP-binding protein
VPLTATRLTRRFGDRLALDDVSFELRQGEILALLGPNGAGKTTTLRILAGLIAPTSGSVHIDGDVMTAKSGALRARIGLLTEAPGLWDRLSVRENLLTYARLYGIRAAERAVDVALRTLDIESRADQVAAHLSKGLRQRVALARAIVHEPGIVLLDEPTSGLDPESARDVRTLIVRLRDQGRAVLLSTHNLDEVERLANRIALLRTHLVALDTPIALRQYAFHRRVRIILRGDALPYAARLRTRAAIEVHADGSALSITLPPSTTTGSAEAAVDTPAIVRALVESGADIESVVAEEPSLEDTYLRLLRSDADD